MLGGSTETPQGQCWGGAGVSSTQWERERDKERQVSVYVGATEVRREANFGSIYISSKDNCQLGHISRNNCSIRFPPTLQYQKKCLIASFPWILCIKEMRSMLSNVNIAWFYTCGIEKVSKHWITWSALEQLCLEWKKNLATDNIPPFLCLHAAAVFPAPSLPVLCFLVLGILVLSRFRERFNAVGSCMLQSC